MFAGKETYSSRIACRCLRVVFDTMHASMKVAGSPPSSPSGHPEQALPDQKLLLEGHCSLRVEVFSPQGPRTKGGGGGGEGRNSGEIRVLHLGFQIFTCLDVGNGMGVLCRARQKWTLGTTEGVRSQKLSMLSGFSGLQAVVCVAMLKPEPQTQERNPNTP